MLAEGKDTAMKKIVNLTPHAIRLIGWARTLDSAGTPWYAYTGSDDDVTIVEPSDCFLRSDQDVSKPDKDGVRKVTLKSIVSLGVEYLDKWKGKDTLCVVSSQTMLSAERLVVSEKESATLLENWVVLGGVVYDDDNRPIGARSLYRFIDVATR